MGRNTDYEARQRAKGLKKITLWVPIDREAEVKQLASALIQNSDITIDTLRNTKNGQFVSLERI